MYFLTFFCPFVVLHVCHAHCTIHSPPPDHPSLAEQLDAAPEERLAFALADGRGGVLAVRGKRITDTRPTRPTWGFLSGPECIATAVAGWGPYVFLGDAEGTLMRWDISSGKLSALLVGGQGAVKQLHCAPLPANALAAMPSAGALWRTVVHIIVQLCSKCGFTVVVTVVF